MTKVSIVIANYNNAMVIGETIASVLNQSFENFELIIVDDGSTDDSVKEILNFKDSRIKLFCNETNRGLPYTRNKGNRLSSGEYIAVLDADDVCDKDRIRKQVVFLETHPNIGIVGSQYRCFGDSTQKIRKYADSSKLKSYLIFGSCFGHSTVMLRKSLLNTFNLEYDENIKYSLDYDFFFKASKVTDFACLEEVLVKYRVHRKNVTSSHSTEQLLYAKNINARVFSYFLGIEDKEMLEKWQTRYSLDFNSLRDIFLTILWKGRVKGILDSKALSLVCFHNWLHIYCNNPHIRKEVSKRKYINSFPEKIEMKPMNFFRIIRFWLK